MLNILEDHAQQQLVVLIKQERTKAYYIYMIF
jgi:hypothetical protein